MPGTLVWAPSMRSAIRLLGELIDLGVQIRVDLSEIRPPDSVRCLNMRLKSGGQFLEFVVGGDFGPQLACCPG